MKISVGGIAELSGFLREFIAFGGTRTVTVAGLLTLGALLEGVGLTLIVPFIQMVVGGQSNKGRLSCKRS